IPHVLGVDLAALSISNCLDNVTELGLHRTWHLDTVVGLHDEGIAALAGLGVHANNGFAIAPNLLLIDRQVRHFPGGRTQFFIGDIGIRCSWTNSICQSIHALVDSVLVGTRERRKDQVAAVWVALWNAQLVTVLNGGADAGDIREI